MPYSGKLAKMADEQGMTEFELLRDALEATESDKGAADRLGVFPYTVRAAADRLGMRVRRKTVTIVERIETTS